MNGCKDWETIFRRNRHLTEKIEFWEVKLYVKTMHKKLNNVLQRDNYEIFEKTKLPLIGNFERVNTFSKIIEYQV